LNSFYSLGVFLAVLSMTAIWIAVDAAQWREWRAFRGGIAIAFALGVAATGSFHQWARNPSANFWEGVPLGDARNCANAGEANAQFCAQGAPSCLQANNRPFPDPRAAELPKNCRAP
jgi:hypothetical protein